MVAPPGLVAGGRDALVKPQDGGAFGGVGASVQDLCAQAFLPPQEPEPVNRGHGLRAGLGHGAGDDVLVDRFGLHDQRLPAPAGPVRAGRVEGAQGHGRDDVVHQGIVGPPQCLERHHPGCLAMQFADQEMCGVADAVQGAHGVGELLAIGAALAVDGDIAQFGPGDDVHRSLAHLVQGIDARHRACHEPHPGCRRPGRGRGVRPARRATKRFVNRNDHPERGRVTPAPSSRAGGGGATALRERRWPRGARGRARERSRPWLRGPPHWHR